MSALKRHSSIFCCLGRCRIRCGKSDTHLSGDSTTVEPYFFLARDFVRNSLLHLGKFCMADPMQSGMSKRTSRPSAKLLDADNGEEPELRSHKAARDRAIAAEEVSKLSHDLTAVPAPQKTVHAHPTLPATTTASSNPSPASRDPPTPSDLNISDTGASRPSHTVATQSKRASVADEEDIEDEDDPPPGELFLKCNLMCSVLITRKNSPVC